MKIDNVKVYDLWQSIVASGLPMLPEYSETAFDAGVATLRTEYAIAEKTFRTNSHVLRAIKLANTPAGTGHDNFLCGITVSCNVTATQTWWMQFQRYHFAEIVSSQSKMHCLRKMLGKEKTEGKTDDELFAECPMGFELTARVITNYRQLKTIYEQRKNHKLAEWGTFCHYIETLPLAAELITGNVNNQTATKETK